VTAEGGKKLFWVVGMQLEVDASWLDPCGLQLYATSFNHFSYHALIHTESLNDYTHGYPCMQMQPADASFLLLLLAIAMVNEAQSAFTESFVPVNPADIDSWVVLPGLWQQLGWLKAGGRGPSSVKYTMLIDSEKPTAETVVLQWDKSSDMLDFFYSADCWEGDDHGVLKVRFSPDGKTWETIWSATSGKMPRNGYEVLRLKLPVSKLQPKFAIKWEYSYRAAFVECSGIFLDDITFPAVPPAVSTSSPSPLEPLVERSPPLPPSSPLDEPSLLSPPPPPPNGGSSPPPPKGCGPNTTCAVVVGILIPCLGVLTALLGFLGVVCAKKHKFCC
jgi:hypothetical protein